MQESRHAKACGERRRDRLFAAATAEAVERRLLFASISGKVFNDYDADGVVDPTEPALPGWGVFLDLNNNGLRDAGGSPVTFESTNVPKSIPDNGQVASTLTVSGLSGTITDLDVAVDVTHDWDGDVSLYLLSPTGVQVTLADQAGGINNDGHNFTETVFDDEATDSIDDVTPFGAPYTGHYRPSSSLWQVDDTDPNGVWKLTARDSATGETGTLDRWSIVITTAEPVATTNAEGNYLFADLAAGTYAVRELPPAAPFARTSPAGDGSYAVTVAPDDDALGRDFGNRPPPGHVQGLHWNDLDGDGARDAGEPGLAGVTVYADLNENAAFDAGAEPSTVATSDGTYDLQDVPPGDWVVREILPPGQVQTYPTSPAGLIAAAATAPAGGQLASAPQPLTTTATTSSTARSLTLTPTPTPPPTAPPASPVVAPVWAPSTPKSDVDAFLDAQQASQQQRTAARSFTFDDANRWTSTATNGPGLVRGQAVTLTWTVVPDGTPIGSYVGEPGDPSDLRAFLTAVYGSEDAWMAKFQQIFDSWSGYTGVSYQHVTYDDGGEGGNELTTGNGTLGVRADIRIGGHYVDGESGILAYNSYPGSGGDMVIDTSDAGFFGYTDGDSLGLRNVLAHEHGHGLGLSHVVPVEHTKLMEPYVSYAFDGPQPDDILAANRGYGDRFEKGAGNDSIATATPLGPLKIGTRSSTTHVSIDGTGDVDFYRFAVAAPGRVAVSLEPIGSTYLSGEQFGADPTEFNSLAQNDLTVSVVSAGGTTIAFADNAGPGGAEALANVPLPAAGDYYVRVTGAVDAAQMYDLHLTAANSLAGGHLVHVDSAGTVGGVDFASRGAVTTQPPQVQQFVVNDGSAQRSVVKNVTVLFDQAVALDGGAITFAGRNGAGAATTMSFANPSSDGKTWVLSFAGADLVGGSLADGVYDVRVVASKVHAGTPSGVTMAADAPLTFHRLFGDSDGNRTVNTADYGRFRLTFGQAAGAANFNPLFDYDGNGTINTADYGRFRTRFGTSLLYS